MLLKSCLLILVLSLSALQAEAATASIYWKQSCPFPREDCGIDNQPIMGSYFEPGYSYIGTNYEKVMLLDARYAGSSAARLITPYIKSTRRQSICVTLEYLMENKGVNKLTVIQQDRMETKTIYEVSEDKKGKWRVAKMDIALRAGIARYFIEARVNQGKSGVVMIRAFNYVLGKCTPEYNRSALFMRRSRLLSKYFELQD